MRRPEPETKQYHFIRCTVIILLLLACIPAEGQKASMKGAVHSAEEGKALSEVEVLIDSLDIRTKTNQEGKYHINDVPPGKHKVTVFLPGWKIKRKYVTLAKGTNKINFTLHPLFEELDDVTITGKKDSSAFDMSRLPSVQGTGIYAGKKTEVIHPDKMNANKATNQSRQIYAKVAGAHVWESGGGGVQLDISTRGLNPKRSAHINTRQNGYDISADALGYPESYYTPPANAIEQIEVVRGASSLQYGPQFGGMINFVLKDAPEDKAFELKTRNTAGSFGLFNNFTSIGGTIGKTQYYGYFQKKTGKGWRPHSRFDQVHGYGKVTYHPNENLDISLEYTRMYYLAQQPGGLTDNQFESNPDQATRKRNWFKVGWNLGALNLNYRFSNKTRLNTRTFGLLGSREALGNLDPPNRIDHGGKRLLLKDRYRNYGNETRLLHKYQIGGNKARFLIGTRFYRGRTKRIQGRGPEGNQPDFTLNSPEDPYYSDYIFPSQNLAAFAENIFYITENFTVTPGIRVENIQTFAEGSYKNRIKDIGGNPLSEETIHENKSRKRSFMLAGLGLGYYFSPAIELYGNVSQNYRGVTFNDIRLINPNLRVDPNIKDERGYSASLGARGKAGNFLNYDVSLFYMKYKDRIGSILKKDTNLYKVYRYRTNIADATFSGLEAFAETEVLHWIFPDQKHSRLSIFTNLSLTHARYTASDEPAIDGNQVEMAVPVMLKTGLEYSYNNFSINYQYSYNGTHYTDATNAPSTPSGVNGVIPAYQVMDLSMGYKYKSLKISAGINNLTNNIYFSRRATGYPGPGIIPAQPRNFYIGGSLTF